VNGAASTAGSPRGRRTHPLMTRRTMTRSLHFLTAVALAAVGGAALDAGSNPLFAEGATCSSGTTSVCQVVETCTDYGWSFSITPPSIGQTCLAKTVRSYYWSAATTDPTTTTRTFVPKN
jgi:hypothetical protein